MAGKKPTCPRDGESRRGRHHPGGARPLVAIWRCHPCHLTLHADRRRRARHPVNRQREGRRRR